MELYFLPFLLSIMAVVKVGLSLYGNEIVVLCMRDTIIDPLGVSYIKININYRNQLSVTYHAEYFIKQNS